MCTIAVSIPEEVMYDTRMSPESAGEFVRKAVALSLYTQRGVSIGYCAQIAGMAEEDFIRFLGENGKSIFSFADEREFLEELGNA